MKKYFSLLLISFLSIFIFGSLDHKDVTAQIKPADNGNWYWDYESQLNDSYYSGLSGITNPTEFKSKLHTIISTGVSMGSYADAWSSLKTLDEDPNNSNNIICIYTGQSIPKSNQDGSSSGSPVWNREHVWAKSYGFSSSSYDAYNDIHHLHASEKTINSTRNNSWFKELDNVSADSYGNKNGKPYFEPRDCVKGDVARSLMYMEVRYTGDSLSDGLKLTLTNNTSYISHSGDSYRGEGYHGLLDTLIKWHVEDPVDDFERRRNDEAYKIQRNRNPFIDHPEYANIIYNSSYVGEEKIKVTYSVDEDVNFNYTDTKNYLKGDLVTKPSETPTKNGYKFICWSTEKNNVNKKWNFETDKLSEKITLYPIWEELETSLFIHDVSALKAQLMFNYSETATVSNESSYVMATSNSDIKIGSEIIIVNKSSSLALSTTQNNNNRGITSVTIKNNEISQISSDVQVIELEEGLISNTYAFKVNSGYLYAASSSSNHLKTQSAKSENGSWSISIASNGNATIKANPNNSNLRGWLRYNSQSTIFSCYSSGQEDVVIFVKQSGNSSGISFENMTIVYQYTITSAAFDKFNSNYKFGFEINNSVVEGKVSKQGNQYVVTYTLSNITDFAKTNNVKPVLISSSNEVSYSNLSSNYSVRTLAAKYLANLNQNNYNDNEKEIVNSFKELLEILAW